MPRDTKLLPPCGLARGSLLLMVCPRRPESHSNPPHRTWAYQPFLGVRKGEEPLLLPPHSSAIPESSTQLWWGSYGNWMEQGFSAATVCLGECLTAIGCLKCVCLLWVLKPGVPLCLNRKTLLESDKPGSTTELLFIHPSIHPSFLSVIQYYLLSADLYTRVLSSVTLDAFLHFLELWFPHLQSNILTFRSCRVIGEIKWNNVGEKHGA